MPQFDAGPVGSSDSDLYGMERTRTLGPFVESRQGTNLSFVAVRPFYSRTSDYNADRRVSDIVWPLGMVKTRENETDWRIFPAFGHDFDAEDATSRHRWSVFPILFGGEDVHGDRYFAIFPLGGTLNEFLMRSRIWFVLFPLYAYSEQADNKTHSVLWPFISHTRGNDVVRWRVFPFYGYSYNKDRWTKRFVLWPFWSSVNYHYPNQEGGGFILFPLFGKVDVGDRHARMVLPPLFKWERDGDDHRALNCPWPIVQIQRGDVDRTYLWPLFGTESREQEKQWFALWPLVSARSTERVDHTFRRFRILPLVYYESKTAEEEETVESPDVTARYFKFWPLFSYRREEDVSLFRLLALWPLKHTSGIERNWAPLWSLYTREKVGSSVDSELLWGVYRHRRNAEAKSRSVSIFPLIQTSSSGGETPSRSWSLLYGLLGYEREGLHRRLTLLYFLRLGRLGEKVDLEAEVAK